MTLDQLTNKSFSSKLLLFGEYIILNGAAAFALPFDKFSGVFEADTQTDPRLLPFFKFLDSHFKDRLNRAKLDHWINDGIKFTSSIKEGYGIGSSGSLTAATYHEFFIKEDLSKRELQQTLASIEAFFHGKSSGADALSIYLNHAILVNPDRDIALMDLKTKDLPGYFYIVDTGIKRSTKHLVDHFMLNINTEKNKKQLKILEDANQASIDASINQKSEELALNFKKISQIQFQLFNHMIPIDQIKIWEKGLDTGDYHIKLLGAGGGGYLLVYSIDKINFESKMIQLINH